MTDLRVEFGDGIVARSASFATTADAGRATFTRAVAASASFVTGVAIAVTFPEVPDLPDPPPSTDYTLYFAAGVL